MKRSIFIALIHVIILLNSCYQADIYSKANQKVPIPEILVMAGNTEISFGDVYKIQGEIESNDKYSYFDGIEIKTEFIIKNTGTSSLFLTGIPPIEISGSDNIVFNAIQPDETEITPGNSVSFTITFNPINLQKKSVTVKIMNSDMDVGDFNFLIEGTVNSYNKDNEFSIVRHFR